jgi:hypothetical protein
MNLLVSFGARGLEDLRKQQNKMKDKGRTMSANQQVMQYGSGGNGSGGGGVGPSGNFATGGGGNGGSGVVILKYPLLYNITIGAGLTSTTTIVGNFKVTRFTAGTGNVTF